MSKLHLENVLSPCIIAILQSHDISYDLTEQDGRYIAELEFYSEFEGDQIESVWFDKTDSDRSFANSLEELAENWDVDDYINLWLEAKRHRPDICRLTARQLVKDGEWTKDFLKEVSEEINQTI